MDKTDAQLKLQLEKLPYFTVSLMLQLTGQHPDVVRVQLSRWQKTGKIIRLKRGIYMTKTFADAHRKDLEFTAAVSSIIEPHSYLSREYVLQEHQVLTEATYLVTAMTRKNTQSYTNPLGSFAYTHQKNALYTGYQLFTYQGITYAKASKAKALFDFLNARTLPPFVRVKSYNPAEDLRLNLGDWAAEDRQEFAQFCEHSHSPKMQYLLQQLRRYVWPV